MLKNLTSLIFGKGHSNRTAKNRLQMVLVQDRSGLTSTEMELFKKDLLDVISKYFAIETKDVDVEWKRTDNETALVINTPVTGKIRAVPKDDKKKEAVGG